MKALKNRLIPADLIIFDLDGTLIDSSEDIAWATNRTLETMGYGRLDVESIKEGIGWGVRALLEKLMPKEGPERINMARDRFLEFYGHHLTVDTYMYPGVKETVGRLHSKKKTMAIVTNKPEALAQRILKDIGLAEFFVMVLGGDSLLNRKPHPEPVLKILNIFGADPEKSVIVGDSPMDCETGKRAGISTIGVSYGFRAAGELKTAGCDVIIGKISELIEVIK